MKNYRIRKRHQVVWVMLCFCLSVYAQPMEYFPESSQQNENTHSMSANCDYTIGNTRHYGLRYNHEVPHYFRASDNKYILQDNCRNIRTIDRLYYDGSHSSDAEWLAPIERDPFSAHWGAKVAHDFFHYELNRNGHDGNGAQLLVNVHSDLPGDGEGLWCNPVDFSVNVSVPDVANLENIGHEYAHAIFWGSKWDQGFVPPSLYLFSEARSITEGLCNIMGNEVERFAWQSPTIVPDVNMSTDFAIDVWENGEFFPDFTTNAENFCTYYKGTNWNPDAFWFTGATMYYRSNVISHLFYLLAEPNPKFNYQNPDNPNPIIIDVIKPLDVTYSRKKATKLFFDTAMKNIKSNWTYKDFAFELIEESKIKYGLCSAQTENVFKALYAVGLAEYPLSIDFCDVTTPSANKSFYSPHSMTLGENCTKEYYTGIPSAHIDMHFYAGNFFIDGNVTFSGSGDVTFDKNLCNGANAPGNTPFNSVARLNPNNEQANSPSNFPNETSIAEMEVFPNPFSQHFTIKIKNEEESQSGDLMLYDHLGQLLLQKSYSEFNGDIQEEWDVAFLPPGIYLVRWVQGTQTITQQIVKQ